MGPGDIEPDGDCRIEVGGGTGVDETTRPAPAAETGSGCARGACADGYPTRGANPAAIYQDRKP